MKVAVAVGLAATLLLAGCARSLRPPATADDPGVAVWELPAASLGTQRLYRVSYEGPDGGGSFRLTLRLLREDRYQLRAVDPVGRALWSLDVEGDGGLWLDHRAAAACRLEGSLEVAAGQLTPFPLSALPALLLGRLPARPPGVPADEVPTAGAAADPESGGGPAEDPAPADLPLDFVDREGRRWSAVVEGGTLVSWSMSEPGESVPGVWWQRHGGESLLSDRDRGVQLTWRESVVERLTGALPSLAVPSSYSLVSCAVLQQRPADDGAGERRVEGVVEDGTP